MWTSYMEQGMTHWGLTLYQVDEHINFEMGFLVFARLMGCVYFKACANSFVQDFHQIEVRNTELSRKARIY